MGLPDYYSILEVPPTATTVEIKRSYRRLVRMHHPDLNSQALDDHIKQLNEAYRVLSGPTRRAAYDEQREDAAWRAAMEEARRRKQEQARREPKMTWAEGVAGFFRELKKGLQEDS